jgi:Cu+-exporting ATPase
MSHPKRIRMQVVGENTLHCSGCESTVEFALRKLPGVTSINADHKEQLIEVELNTDETSIDQIEDSLEWIGYEVETK